MLAKNVNERLQAKITKKQTAKISSSESEKHQATNHKSLFSLLRPKIVAFVFTYKLIKYSFQTYKPDKLLLSTD